MSDGALIHLIEDDPSDVLFFKRALGNTGFLSDLRVSFDGQSAQDYLWARGDFADRQAHPLPSYIYLDLKLPRMGGLELLQWIRRVPQVAAIPVVVLTSSRELKDVTEATALGAKAYCVKPLETSKLVDILRCVHLWLCQGKMPEERVKAQFLRLEPLDTRS